MNSTFSGSAIASWPLGGARKGAGKSGKHFSEKRGQQSMLVCINSPLRIQESRSSSATGFVERKVFLYYRILNVLHALSATCLFLYEISFFQRK